MRTFKSPGEGKCIVCGTNKKSECILVPIDGTGDGNITEAAVLHTDCIKLRYKKDALGQGLNVLYQKIDDYITELPHKKEKR